MFNHLLVFIHIPKTAGTSFRVGLEKVISQEKFAYDYGADGYLTSHFIRELIYKENNFLKTKQQISTAGISILAGHFHASKYLSDFAECSFCTFLRDPIQRTISEYKHLVKHEGYQESLESFASNAEYRNRQSQLLALLPLHKIGFLGITERYAESLNLFRLQFEVTLSHEYTNIARDNLNTQHLESEEAMSILEENNQEDIALYQQAILEFENRLKHFSLSS